jgi:hypothetical protein
MEQSKMTQVFGVSRQIKKHLDRAEFKFLAAIQPSHHQIYLTRQETATILKVSLVTHFSDWTKENP